MTLQLERPHISWHAERGISFSKVRITSNQKIHSLWRKYHSKSALPLLVKNRKALYRKPWAMFVALLGSPFFHFILFMDSSSKEHIYTWSYVDLRTSRWPNDQVYHATYHPLFLFYRGEIKKKKRYSDRAVRPCSFLLDSKQKSSTRAVGYGLAHGAVRSDILNFFFSKFL